LDSSQTYGKHKVGALEGRGSGKHETKKSAVTV